MLDSSDFRFWLLPFQWWFMGTINFVCAILQRWVPIFLCMVCSAQFFFTSMSVVNLFKILSVDWYVRNRIKHVHPVLDGNFVSLCWDKSQQDELCGEHTENTDDCSRGVYSSGYQSVFNIGKVQCQFPISIIITLSSIYLQYLSWISLQSNLTYFIHTQY